MSDTESLRACAELLREVAGAIDRLVATNYALKLQLEHVRPDGVRTLGCGARARKAFARLGISTIDELCRKSANELLAVKNFGVTCLEEVRSALEKRGRSLRDDHKYMKG